MTNLESTPVKSVRQTFGLLRRIHRLSVDNASVDASGKRRIDRIINEEYVQLGMCILPEATAHLQADKESWKRIQIGTEPYRRHIAFLLGKQAPDTPRDIYEELIATAEETLARTPADRETRLIRKHPLIGSMVAHLSKAAAGATFDPRFEREYGGWFFDVLDTIENAQTALNTYISRCAGRVLKHSLMITFLADLKADIEDFLVSCAHMACSFAMHAQEAEKNCAVFMPLTSYHIGNGRRESITNRMRKLLALPVYQKYREPIAGAGVDGRCVHVPTFMSVVDLKEFTKFFTEYLEQFAEGKMRLAIHPTRTPDHDARIRFVPTDRRFGDFDTRIDFDRHGNIALDIGHVDLFAALRYAEELGKESKRHEMVMRYSDIIDKDGSITNVRNPHNPSPRTEQYPYTSVMRSRLSEKERMALVAAGIISAGKEIVFSSTESVTYHLQGRLNQQKYRDNFSIIANCAQMNFR